MKIFDISVSLNADLPVWPGDPQIVLERYRGISEGNVSNNSRIACSVHAGTHVDAPAHFIKKGATIEQLPLDVLIGSAKVVELPNDDIITPEFLDPRVRYILFPADSAPTETEKTTPGNDKPAQKRRPHHNKRRYTRTGYICG